MYFWNDEVKRHDDGSINQVSVTSSHVFGLPFALVLGFSRFVQKKNYEKKLTCKTELNCLTMSLSVR